MAHKTIRKYFRFDEEVDNMLKKITKHENEVYRVHLEKLNLNDPTELTESVIVRKLIRTRYEQLKAEGYDLK